MTKIKILDEMTIAKIAAGEIIENPKSIVKELVENCIDAAAKNIIVEITNGGIDYIRVTDDGVGMSIDDLPYAITRHATSKLENFDDIYNLSTLGFRGEALASIVQAGNVLIITKQESDIKAVRASIINGKIDNIDFVGAAKGTTIEVRELFDKLPVRKKFLKSSRQEGMEISDLMTKLALSNPNVSFTFIRDGKFIFKTKGDGLLPNVAYSVLGKDISKNLISIMDDSRGIVTGLIGNQSLFRTNRIHQYIFVNGRSVYDSNISKAIEEVYLSVIPINRFPIFILFLNLDGNSFDVNVHPSKTRIKFADLNNIITLIKKIVGETIYNSLSVTNYITENNSMENNDTIFETYSEPKYKSIFEDVVKESKSVESEVATDFFHTDVKYNDILSNDNDAIVKESNIGYICEEVEENHSLINKLASATFKTTIFDTYILYEKIGEDTIFLIDQHAAHERINYEKFKLAFKNDSIQSQLLLAPIVCELSTIDMDKYRIYSNIFTKIGFSIDELDEFTLIIREVPFVFGCPSSKTFFVDILDKLENRDYNNATDFTLDKIMKLSCVSSIKAGHKVSEIEATALLNELVRCDDGLHCPHGRPTIIEMSKKEIEKMFLRIM